MKIIFACTMVVDIYLNVDNPVTAAEITNSDLSDIVQSSKDRFLNLMP